MAILVLLVTGQRMGWLWATGLALLGMWLLACLGLLFFFTDVKAIIEIAHGKRVGARHEWLITAGHWALSIAIAVAAVIQGHYISAIVFCLGQAAIEWGADVLRRV